MPNGEGQEITQMFVGMAGALSCVYRNRYRIYPLGYRYVVPAYTTSAEVKDGKEGYNQK